MFNKKPAYPPWIIVGDKLTSKQLKLLRSAKLFIGTPMLWGLCFAEFVMSLYSFKALCTSNDIQLSFAMLTNEPNIDRARNTLTNHMLETNSTHFVSIDSDVGFDPYRLLELILCLIVNKLDLLGASYPKKGINWPAVARGAAQGVQPANLWHLTGDHVVIPENANQQAIDVFSPYRVKWLGGGFYVATRRCYEEFRRRNPEAWYYENGNPSAGVKHTMFYTNTDISPDRIWLGEDFGFSTKMRNIGIESYIAPWIDLTHTGTYTFNGHFLCSYNADGNYPHAIK